MSVEALVQQLVATACHRSASRKARSAAKKTLFALGVDVAAMTVQHRAERPKHTRAQTSAANRLVADVVKKLNPRAPRPPRADRTPKPEGTA